LQGGTLTVAELKLDNLAVELAPLNNVARELIKQEKVSITTNSSDVNQPLLTRHPQPMSLQMSSRISRPDFRKRVQEVLPFCAFYEICIGKSFNVVSLNCT
jgi:hypothetical protein